MKNTQKNFTLKDIVWIKIFAALLMVFLSSMYFTKTGTFGYSKLVLSLPDSCFHLIFGLAHAFIVSKQRNDKYEDLFFRNLISNWFLYTAFYKVILIPKCGLGFIQWIAMTIILLHELGLQVYSSRIKKTSTVKPNPVYLTIFCGLLWLVKLIIRYSVPMDLASDLTGNETAMNFVAVLIGIAALYALKTVFSFIKINKESVKSKSALVGKKIAKGTGKFLSTIATLVTSLFNPIVLLIIAGVVLLGGGVCVLLFAKNVENIFYNIRNDIIALVSPILHFVLDTDNASFTDDILNTIGTFSAAVTFIFTVILESTIIKKADKEVKIENAKNNEDKNRLEQIQKLRQMESRKSLEQNKKISLNDILQNEKIGDEK